MEFFPEVKVKQRLKIKNHLITGGLIFLLNGRFMPKTGVLTAPGIS